VSRFNVESRAVQAWKRFRTTALAVVILGVISSLIAAAIWDIIPHRRVSDPPMMTTTTPLNQVTTLGTNRRLDEFKSLVNKVKIDSSRKNIALVIDSTPPRSGFSPQLKLYGLCRNGSVNIIGNLFHEERFIRSDFFNEIYEGDTKLLKESGALHGIDFLLIGKLAYSFRKSGILDSDLISCDMNLTYRIISREGRLIRSDHLRETGAGFTEDRRLRADWRTSRRSSPKRLFEIIEVTHEKDPHHNRLGDSAQPFMFRRLNGLRERGSNPLRLNGGEHPEFR